MDWPCPYDSKPFDNIREKVKKKENKLQDINQIRTDSIPKGNRDITNCDKILAFSRNCDVIFHKFLSENEVVTNLNGA